MNILYHHRTLADGAEGIHIPEMVDAFRALGHQVTLESIAQSPAAGQGRGGALAAIRRHIPQAAFECAALGLNVSDYVATTRRLRRGRFDLLYKRHALLDVGAVRAARRHGVPVVLEVNTAYSAPAVRQFEPVRLLSAVRRAERDVVRMATLVVAVSTPLAEYLRELAGPEPSILVLPNGANLQRFDPSAVGGEDIRVRYGLQGRFVAGWAGVLRRWHGVEVLIEALATVPDVHLLLIGDGPDRPVLEQLARARGVAERIVVTGRVPHSEIPRHLGAIDVAVAAGDRTGFASPMKIVEYMAMGKPTIVPRQRNLEDLVEADRTGLTFREGDAIDLARCIQVLRDSRALRDRLGQAARAAVEVRFNWRQSAERILSALGSATPAA